jgi:DNA-binding response OmpR family regulator
MTTPAKPFSAPEVVGASERHLRRACGFEEGGSVLRVGRVEMDRASRRCSVDGRPVDLT